MSTYTILNSQFTVFTDVNSGKKFAKCNYCESLLKYHHSTSSLTYHLRCKHSSVAQLNKNYQVAKPPEVDASKLLAVKPEPNIPANILHSVIRWIAKDMRPLEIIEDDGFKELLIAASGITNLQLPDRNTALSYLEFLYHKQKLLMEEAVGASSRVALTTDSWSCGECSFSSIRCHYVSKDWALKSALLGVEQSNDKYMAVNVDYHLSSLATDWKMNTSEISHMVINTLAPVNDSESIRFDRSPCFAYLLQLCINNAIVACPLDDKMENEISNFYSCYVEQDPVRHQDINLKLNHIMSMVCCYEFAHLFHGIAVLVFNLAHYDEQVLWYHSSRLSRIMLE